MDFKVMTSRELAEWRPEPRPLTPAELDEMSQRVEQATPGPWIAFNEHGLDECMGGPVCVMDEDPEIVVGQACDFGPTNDPRDDAAFIAKARTDMPRLIAEVRRLWGLTAGRADIAA